MSHSPSIARRLRYPIRLGVAGRHVFLVWQNPSFQFNIEVSNPQGMTIPSDEELQSKVIGVPHSGQVPLVLPVRL